jgi:hypothetical protein
VNTQSRIRLEHNMKSILFALMSVVILAGTGCSGSLRIHPVDVNVDHQYDDCRDGHRGCNDRRDHRGERPNRQY